MTFIDAIKTCFSKYADFSGKASRSEFWWWVLFVFIGSVIFGVISEKLSLVFSLATLLPYIAVTARRLHDIDKSGWMQLVGLIPLVGWIFLLIWLVSASKPSTRFD